MAIELELAYIAELFDGEGSVGIYYVQSSKNGKKYPRLVARITNNDVSVLNWVKDTTGLGSVYRHSRIDERHPNASYEYQTTSRSARNF